MKSFLIKIFQTSVALAPEFDLEHAFRVATATLLIEISRADFHEQESEIKMMRQLLLEQFDLGDSELDELMQQASERADKLVSLQHITGCRVTICIPCSVYSGSAQGRRIGRPWLKEAA